MRAAGALLVALAACDAASTDLGYDADLQIPNAQFRPGAFPAPTGGPEAMGLLTPHLSVLIGREHETLHGILSADARGAILGIAGRDGAWILPAGPPSFDAPDEGTIDSRYGLAAHAEPGPFTMQMAAIDSAGQIGAPVTVDLVADADPPPTGQLVVSLVWDGAADLDLHVIDPKGGEAWAGNPNTHKRPAPGDVEDPNAYLDGGILDHDGNKGCARDGAPSEHVVWQMPPPPGDYTVRVDARAMCGDGSAPWYVEVLDATGTDLAAARGIATPDDVTYQPHGTGAGLTAVTFSR